MALSDTEEDQADEMPPLEGEIEATADDTEEEGADEMPPLEGESEATADDTEEEQADEMPALQGEIEAIADDAGEAQHLPILANDNDETQRLLAHQRTIGELDAGHVPHDYVPRGYGLYDYGDNWFCSAMCIAILCCVAVVWMMCWVYGTKRLQLGPNSSILIKANHLVVDYIEVVEHDEAKGSMLYGFYKKPPLDVLVSWSEIHKISLPNSAQKEWMYYLNEGSQMKILYSLNSSRSSSLIFVIAQGKEEIANWLKDSSYSSAKLSWKIIQGNGTIQEAVLESSAYYVAVRNLHTESVEVQLNIRIKAFIFNTTEPYYKCIPAQGQCSFKLFFLGGNVAVLTSPGRQLGIISGSNVEISYGLRWISYLVVIGGISALVILINCFLNHIRRGNIQDPCTVCFNAPKERVFHPCGHMACSTCATRIAREFKKCHICRGPIEAMQRLIS